MRIQQYEGTIDNLVRKSLRRFDKKQSFSAERLIRLLFENARDLAQGDSWQPNFAGTNASFDYVSYKSKFEVYTGFIADFCSAAANTDDPLRLLQELKKRNNLIGLVKLEDIDFKATDLGLMFDRIMKDRAQDLEMRYGMAASRDSSSSYRNQVPSSHPYASRPNHPSRDF